MLNVDRPRCQIICFTYAKIRRNYLWKFGSNMKKPSSTESNQLALKMETDPPQKGGKHKFCICRYRPSKPSYWKNVHIFNWTLTSHQ